MKIRSTLEPKPAVRAENKAKALDRATSAKSENDSVSFSSDADQMKAIAEKASSVSDVRTEKVAELRRQVAENKYHVPAKDIADSLVDYVIKHRMRE